MRLLSVLSVASKLRCDDRALLPTVRHVIQDEGIAGLWKGTAVTVTRYAPVLHAIEQADVRTEMFPVSDVSLCRKGMNLSHR